ncbi:MAG: hypothetical protein FVQ81_08225 [Candidatus Glassbacteria bacterium]|nr:hypothetical protein [Candidatus Glassbacteria bacterium]
MKPWRYVFAALVIVACTSQSGREQVVDLSGLPPAVQSVLGPAAADLASPEGRTVPHLFAPDSLDLPTVARRTFALIDHGISHGKLDTARTRLLDEYADYMLAFQYEEEQDFSLAGAALALVGMLHSTPDSLDPRYGYGLARMYYPLSRGWENVSGADSAAVLYVARTAMEKNLPLIPEVLDYARASGGDLDRRAKTFHLGDSREEFIESLELPGQWGGRLKRALGDREREQAEKVIARYYAEKLAPFAPERVGLGDGQLAEADDLLENVFILRAHMVRRHDFGDEVDWTTVLDGDIESNVSINNHPHLLLLARAWKATSEKKYRDKLIELLESWMEQSPRPDIGQGRLQWRTLEAGARPSVRWPQIMALAASDSMFVDRMFFPLAYFLYLHADYLMVHNMRHLSNWGQVESAGLLSGAMIVSEHPDAPLYRRTALRRFDYLNREMYFPDGLHTENSFYYHAFPLRTQAEVYKLALSMGVALDSSWTGVIERGIEALVLGTLPDGSKPMVSDTGPAKSYIGAMQKTGRELFPGNQLFQYPVGIPEYPDAGAEQKSHWFRWAGYGVMREAWPPYAQYMLFDMGYYGTNHQHEDKLNLIVYAEGRELIHDPGIYRYSNDGFERYFRGSRGHNVVLVDGLGQRRDMFFDKEHPYAGESFPDSDSRWEEHEKYILAAGAYRAGFAQKLHPLWYDGPRDQERESLIDIHHERKVLWVKEEYWVVLDRLLGPGEHRLEQVWHFSPVITTHDADGVGPGVVELIGNRTAVGDNPGVADIAVMQVGGADIRARKEKGQKDPHVGWTSLYGENPAWDVTFEAKRPMPATFVTVLYPLRHDDTPLPEIRTYSQDENGAAFDLVFTDHIDRLVIAAGKSVTAKFPGGHFTGELLLLRKERGRSFEPVFYLGLTDLFME